MTNVQQYTIVCGDTLYDLIKAVDDRVHAGWEPIGNHVIEQRPDRVIKYQQAMVLKG